MSRLRDIGESVFYNFIPKKIRQKISNKVKKYYTIIERIRLHGFINLPRQVIIETNSICYRNCSYCPGSSEDKSTLDDETYKSIINQLKEWGFKGRINPQGYNEPLTDERIFEFISHTKNELPNSELIIFTNGDLLDNETIDKLVNKGVNEIKVSLHEYISEEDEERFIKLAKEYKSISLADRREGKRKEPLWNRAGSVNIKNIVQTKSSCYKADIMFIRSNGDVVLCCNDANSQYIIGNVKEKSLKELWNDPEFKKIREEVIKGRYSLEMCGYENI